MAKPFTGPFAELRRLRKNVVELANAGGRTQRGIALAVKREVRGQLREQFKRGEGPYGRHKLTKSGKLALVSRKLPQDFDAQVRPGGLFVTVSRAPWLRAHHEGHVFPPRAAGGQRLTFNKDGRLLRSSRVKRQKFVFDRVARSHTIGRRVLPERPIIPDVRRGMPPSWASRINAAAAVELARWARKATR